MAEMTPMMQQYLDTKKGYEDCILFYRLGDFYEMFFDDANIASKELELTLTGRNCGQEERAPMCGVPFHAVDGYISKLVNKGYKVAVCDQMEDPKLAKGLVKREITRIVTPGTNITSTSLSEDKNNYLCAVFYMDNGAGIATVDVTTGKFLLTEAGSIREILDEIYKYMPSELICNAPFTMCSSEITELRDRNGISLFVLPERYFDGEACEKALLSHFKAHSLSGIGLENTNIGTTAAGAAMLYLTETQKISLSHITEIIMYRPANFMIIDSASRRNLELTETMRDKLKKGSLLGVLDRTKTAMGARRLREYIEQPLISAEKINARLDAIEELNGNIVTREEIREYLGPIYDLERLMGRVCYMTANPRDLIALMSSLSMLPYIKTLLGDCTSKELQRYYSELDELKDIHDEIESTIDPDPPISVREGGFIRSGSHAKVDELRNAKTEGKKWLAELEAREKEATGIKNLRIKYSHVFGYCLEVTNSYSDLVPVNWVRKQTLTNAERYTMQELKELEDKILNAEERLTGLEYDIFTALRDSIAARIERVKKTADAIAGLDALTSLAYVADRNGYVRPKINLQGRINIKNGRHPVVEKMLEDGQFVANDTYLDNFENRISIITGPNMAGKSTYMRQTALITLMAQIGSFVPCEEADIGIVDRIFTRVGASDDLASGQSTFMVEMNEVANILKNATEKSLLILDEIGRGTSTYDGLSIAWAVVEYIADKKLLGAKTLFATHYHELTELEGKLDSVNNYCVAVKENGEDIVFLRKIVKGGADKSYGIQVAKLAGVPKKVLDRAREISEELSVNDIVAMHDKAEKLAKEDLEKKKKKKKDYDENQLSLFANSANEEIIEELRNADISSMTPLEALNKLYSVQERLRENF